MEIEVQEAKIDGKSVTDISFDAGKQTVTFKFDDDLTTGSIAKLYIKFTGELNDKMAGFTEPPTKKMARPNTWQPPKWNLPIVVEHFLLMMNLQQNLNSPSH